MLKSLLRCVYWQDMCAGVGPIAVAAAKRCRMVYANDLNPAATEYLTRNAAANGLAHKLEVSSQTRFLVREVYARIECELS